MYNFRVYPTGITTIPNFIHIRSAYVELKLTDGQTDKHDQSIRCSSLTLEQEKHQIIHI